MTLHNVASISFVKFIKRFAVVSLIRYFSIAATNISGERFPAATWQFVAEKRHAGDFRCTAINSVESGVDKLTLNVLYGPILKVKVPFRVFDISCLRYIADFRKLSLSLSFFNKSSTSMELNFH